MTLEYYYLQSWSLSSIPAALVTFDFSDCKHAKQQDESTAESAWQGGEVQFDASRLGEKMLNSSRNKNEGMCRSGEGGGGLFMNT